MEVNVGTGNIKDITPKLIDAQIESSCSRQRHLEEQKTALQQMELDKQTDIYNFLWGHNREARTLSYEKGHH